MTTLPTPQKFLSDFVKDIVAHPGNRLELIAGYAKSLEAREQAIRMQEVRAVLNGANEGAQERTPAAGSRELNFWDFDYYIKKRLGQLSAEGGEGEPAA